MIIYKAGRIEGPSDTASLSSSPAVNDYASPLQESANVIPISSPSQSEIIISPLPQISISPSSSPYPIISDPVIDTVQIPVVDSIPLKTHTETNGMTTVQSIFSLLIFIAFIYSLYLIFKNQEDTGSMMTLKTIVVVLIVSLLLQVIVYRS
jgi:hypothetical protein